MPSGLIVLRDEQLRAMGSALFDRYFEELMAHLREVFPQRLAAMGDAAARELARKASARGKELGLSRERNLTLFADLSFALGAAWEEGPGSLWLRKILADRSRSEDARMLMIYRRLPRRAPAAGDLPEAP